MLILGRHVGQSIWINGGDVRILYKGVKNRRAVLHIGGNITSLRFEDDNHFLSQTDFCDLPHGGIVTTVEMPHKAALEFVTNGDRVLLTIALTQSGGDCRMGFDAPKTVTIHRKEVQKRIDVQSRGIYRLRRSRSHTPPVAGGVDENG